MKIGAHVPQCINLGTSIQEEVHTHFLSPQKAAPRTTATCNQKPAMDKGGNGAQFLALLFPGTIQRPSSYC